jgi:hypothetical protein
MPFDGVAIERPSANRPPIRDLGSGIRFAATTSAANLWSFTTAGLVVSIVGRFTSGAITLADAERPALLLGLQAEGTGSIEDSGGHVVSISFTRVEHCASAMPRSWISRS